MIVGPALNTAAGEARRGPGGVPREQVGPPPLRPWELPEVSMVGADYYRHDALQLRKNRRARFVGVTRFPGAFRVLPPSGATECDQPLDVEVAWPDRPGPLVQPGPITAPALGGRGSLSARHSSRAETGWLQSRVGAEEMADVVRQVVAQRLLDEQGIRIDPDEVELDVALLPQRFESQRVAMPGLPPHDIAVLAMGAAARDAYERYYGHLVRQPRLREQQLRSLAPNRNPHVTPDPLIFQPREGALRRERRPTQIVFAAGGLSGGLGRSA